MDNPIYDFPIDKVQEALGSRMESKDIFFSPMRDGLKSIIKRISIQNKSGHLSHTPTFYFLRTTLTDEPRFNNYCGITAGIFDSILFLVSVEPALSLLLTIGFFVFFKKIRKFASGRIASLLAKDKEVAAAEDSMTVDEQ